MFRRLFATTNSPAISEVSIHVKPSELNDGYKQFPKFIEDNSKKLVIAGVTFPALMAIWLSFTRQSLANSPVALSLLITGGLIVTNGLMQRTRFDQFSRLSMLTDGKGPTNSPESNTQIRRVLAGDLGQFSWSGRGLTISGIPATQSNLDETDAVQSARMSIRSMDKMTLPDLVLENDTRKAANQVSQRWAIMINVPIAVLNLITLLLKTEKLSPDERAIVVYSIAILEDFIHGKNLPEAREEFRAKLNKCTTPEEVLKQLITFKVIDEGAMSFLKEWVKDVEKVNVQVGPLGSITIGKTAPTFFSRMTPMPFGIETFPIKMNQL